MEVKDVILGKTWKGDGKERGREVGEKMIEEIEIKIYGDERLLENSEVTGAICKDMENAVKKVIPYGFVRFNLVISGRKRIPTTP